MEPKAIVHLSFKINVPKEDVSAIFENRRKNLTRSNGLVSFFCYWEENTSTVGATYIFESRLKAEIYIRDFLIDGLGPKYNVIPQTLTIKTQEIVTEIWQEDIP